MPFAAIKREIETSFGKPIEALFASIEEVAVGAASIAQVHRAVTLDGRDVAVKVLRPGIREKFGDDAVMTGRGARIQKARGERKP